MILEPSALIAVIQEEEDFEVLLEKMADAPSLKISVVGYLEAVLVLTRHRGDGAVQELDEYLRRARVSLVPVSVAQGYIAVEAYLKFGRGRHPAKLNMGDCYSYALAKDFDEPLLYKGNDFPQTDIPAA